MKESLRKGLAASGVAIGLAVLVVLVVSGPV